MRASCRRLVAVGRQVRLHHDPVREADGEVEKPVSEDIDPVLVRHVVNY